MTPATPPCWTCANLRSSDAWPFKCRAFPDGVPDEIAEAHNDHTQPYPGDHGIHYEATT